MKIVQLLPALEQGGVETVVVALSRALAAAGEESVVVSAGGRLVERIRADGARHLEVDLRSKNPFTFFPRAIRLRRLLAAERPDLVCTHSRVPAWLFRWANRTLGLRWVTYAHGANRVSRYSSVMTRGLVTVVPSRFLAAYLTEHYRLPPERLRVISPSVDEARFDPERIDPAKAAELARAWALAPDESVVMAVGRISPVKGYENLLAAVRELAGQRPRLKCVIVGGEDGRHRDYAARLRQTAGEIDALTGRRTVVFAGGDTPVPEALSLASVVVSANIAKPESFGLSMAEALMMDRPVVAKAFGGALDVVRDGLDGVLVRDGDFAAAIRRVLDGRFAGMRESARERFAPATMAARTLALYRELLV